MRSIFTASAHSLRGLRKNKFAALALRFGSDIASYFEEFVNKVSAKDGLKLRCQNVKLFFREP
ncbi:MAG: hypothetical protein BBJ60_10265 [Desulfobacterales bacterium S7086C20]|nr:MAG: hypothetical protein BBJ60_10265 [Desulfobacterales bacterium S7086C20]